MKAYKVTIVNQPGWSDLEAFESANSPGQAKSNQYISAREAGYNFRFTDYRAVRAPEYDHLATRIGSLGWQCQEEKWGVCWADYVRKELAFKNGS